jgi:hypothetical protein
MPTAMELRVEAKQCLELATTANDLYVKTALIELAQRLNRDAHQAERRTRDTSSFSNRQMPSRPASH